MNGFACRIKESQKSKTVLRQNFYDFDWIGTFLFILSMISVLLALQWGGSKYSWDNGRIIVLLIIFAVGMSSFIYSQYLQKERATVPPRLIKQRSNCKRRPCNSLIVATNMFRICIRWSVMARKHELRPMEVGPFPRLSLSIRGCKTKTELW